MSKRGSQRKRYQEIINTFIKNGFSHILFRIGLTDKSSAKDPSFQGDENLSHIGMKLRDTLQQLGPTFVKLGQIASSRRDLVPEEIAIELEKLQDEVAAIPFTEIKTIVETQFERPINEVYASFKEEPLAAASIGQVHVATLFSGEKVAVKVQRPNIKETMETDLQILRNLSKLLESRFSWAKSYNISDIIEEFAHSLRNEIDYTLEARNGERFRKQFAENEYVHAPEIYWEQTTEKVLTMELIEGIKVNHIDELKRSGYNTKKIAQRITDSMIQQILIHGTFHGDPHSGNIFILPHNEVVFMDFGMIGHLTDDLKYYFSSLIIQLHTGDMEGILRTFDKWGLTDRVESRNKLKRDLYSLQSHYYEMPLQQISLGKVMAEIFSIAYTHRIEIPSDVAILGKVILTLENVIEQLDPSVSIMKAVEPYGKQLLAERYHPKYVARKSWDLLLENIEYVSELPKDLNELTKTVKKGKLRLDVNVHDLQSFLRRLDRVSNRLSFSIILLSFSILMVGLIIGAAIVGQTTLLWRLPVIEVGSIVATLMFIFMIFTIFRSGKM
ncbi:MAG TPA: AarF/ABC1/UbiB kinase family protein [Pseudogracilibacillus sp.]|nr:AarF/ABC1/UbiB kinase family protein [Pseudogracilibacillus sp.]